MMNSGQFALNPIHYGIPDRQQLVDLRIWDDHYHGFATSGDQIKQHHEMMFYAERMGVERVISLDIGGTLDDPFIPRPQDNELRALLKANSDRVSGLTPVDPGFPEESLVKIEDWVRKGPCIGIKYPGGNKLGITVDHPNNDRIIRLAKELHAVVYIHTWIKVGGNPRFPGGDNGPGESSPMNLVVLAKRFPDVPLICGHGGGDWELGARVVRPYENVFMEFAGSDPHSGSVDYAVNILGADRIVWGGHGPGRSYSTELSKVLDASISHSDRMKIFGGNYRRIASASFKNKGISIKE